MITKGIHFFLIFIPVSTQATAVVYSEGPDARNERRATFPRVSS